MVTGELISLKLTVVVKGPDTFLENEWKMYPPYGGQFTYFPQPVHPFGCNGRVKLAT